jgi:hypothetical protein
VEEWAAHHRGQGHHPHPAPTQENPERWDCECGYIWRILTIEQIRQKLVVREITGFGRSLLGHLRAVAQEELERLAGH